MAQFDKLFGRTFSRKANAKYIEQVKACFAAKQYTRVCNLVFSSIKSARAKLTAPNEVDSSHADDEQRNAEVQQDSKRRKGEVSLLVLFLVVHPHRCC